MSAPFAAPPARLPSKYDGVQALRLVAALLVVVTHATLYAQDRLDPAVSIWHFGEVGVDLFFVVSGFVMYVSSVGHLGSPTYWRTFAVRRLIRIVPMYWLATTVKLLTLIVLPGAVLHAALDPEKALLSYLFLPSENVDGTVRPLLAVGWTLLFEMFFYTVFTVALLLRRNVVTVTTGVMTVLALGSLLRPDPWPPALFYLDPIVLYFVVGLMVGKLVTEASPRAGLAGIGYVVAVWTLHAALTDPGAFDTDALVRHLGVVVVVLAVVLLEPVLGRFVPRPVVWLGDASYALYLFHPLVGPLVPVVLDRLGMRSAALSVVLTTVVAVAVTSAIYVLVERPVTRFLLRRTRPARRPSAAVDAVPAALPEPVPTR